MASCEEAQQTPLQQTFSCDQQRRGKRVLLGALLGVLLVTVIVAACVAATVSPSGGPASWLSSTAKTRDATVQHTRPSQNGQERRDVREQVRNRRVAPSPAPPRLPLPALGKFSLIQSHPQGVHMLSHPYTQCPQQHLLVMGLAFLVKLKR